MNHHNKKETLPVISSKDIFIGDPSSPVKIVMFGDYECMECAAAYDVIKEILHFYKDLVTFSYRHFPLTLIHQKAHKAAEAAIGAAQEGKFWEMHEYLFTQRHNLGTISLNSYAREIGVKDKKFLDHLINSDYGWNVQDDLREGLQLGVTGIPAFFINGVLFEEKPILKNFAKYLEKMIADTISLKKGDEGKRA